MNATYLLIMVTTMVALFCKGKQPTILLIIITNLIAWYQGVINSIGICCLACFTSVTYLYFQLHNQSKIIKFVLFAMESLFILAFILHYIPGFFNVLAIHAIKVSPLSIPFSMYLNFDKAMAALIIYCVSDLYNLEKIHNVRYRHIIKYTIIAYLLSMVLVFIPAYISGYILFDPSIPNILFVWAINNLFLVCMGEEIIFRGFLQRAFQNSLKHYSNKNGLLAIMFTALLFGIAHFQEGFTYIGLATISGCIYGYAYYQTGKLLCSMIVHFGLNLLHILLFTYPMSMEICK